MRRPATLAVLLMIVVNTMAAACVSDTREIPKCSRMARTTCSHQNRASMRSATRCGESVSRLPEQCRMRGFSQSQVAAISRAERLQAEPAPTAQIEAPDDPLFAATSVGPPETDRGPPRS